VLGVIILFQGKELPSFHRIITLNNRICNLFAINKKITILMFMPRRMEPFSLVRRPGSPYWYYKLGPWKTYKSTGEKSKSEAIKVALHAFEETQIDPGGPRLKTYASPYFIWDKCPHVRRLTSEGKSITKYHVKDMRNIMDNHLFTDPITKLKLPEIKRAHILDFRERLIEKLGYTRTVQKAVSVLKTILKEAYFREDIARDPTAGIGVTKYKPKEIGTFTEEELKQLFPATSPGPWKDLHDYSVFLTAATTGMRRGEILALSWEHVYFDEGFIQVQQAWKDRHEIGLPKWNKKRIVPLPAMLADTLELVKKNSKHTRPQDMVFCYTADTGECLPG